MNRQQKHNTRKILPALLVAGAIVTSAIPVYADTEITGQYLQVNGAYGSPGSSIIFHNGIEEITDEYVVNPTTYQYERTTGSFPSGMTTQISCSEHHTNTNDASVAIDGNLILIGGVEQSSLKGETAQGGSGGGNGGSAALTVSGDLTVSDGSPFNIIGGNASSGYSMYSGGNATLNVTGKLNVKSLTSTGGENNEDSSGDVAAGGIASVTADTYNVGLGYSLTLGGEITNTAFNFANLEFDLTNAENGNTLLMVTGGTPFNMGAFNGNITLINPAQTLQGGDEIILISGGVTGAFAPSIIETDGKYFEIKVSGNNLSATVIPVYNITYNLNNGINHKDNPLTYTAEDLPVTLFNPTRAGYTFTGWTGSNGTTPQTGVMIPVGTTGDLEYTANWTSNSNPSNPSTTTPPPPQTQPPESTTPTSVPPPDNGENDDYNELWDGISDKTFTFNGEYKDLLKVFIDNTTLGAKVIEEGDDEDGERWDLDGFGDYDGTLGKAYAGSTKVTLYKEFLATLSTGTYAISVEFKDGTIEGMEFEVDNGEVTLPDDSANPATGAAISLFGLILAGSVLTIVGKMRKK
ncbi:MAG: InlB B-repeat-containing protein [Oscillospiraceae bacterium]|nr:InlB B-repeat-containing protein [Oscillospiraceae bacterium]